MDLRIEELHQALAVERDDSGQHLVRDRCERIPVSRGSDLVSHHLFGGHVGGRAGRNTGHRLERGALHQLGQSEIGEDGRVVLLEEHVGRLDVPMDDPEPVCVVEARGDAA